MPLEPTEKQLEALAARLIGCVGRDLSYVGTAAEMFAYVRDLVLSEAVKRLDAVVSVDEMSFMGTQVIRTCDLDAAIEAVRAMKGDGK